MQLSAPSTDDPVAPVFDVQRFSVHDGPGIRTTVFLAGCPLRCAWCQNPESFEVGRAPSRSVAAVLAEAMADRDYYTESGGGLTLSGGEPLLHGRFVRELSARARAAGIGTCVQSSGAAGPDAARAVAPHVELFQLDLKHMDDARHRELTGAGCARVHESADALLEIGARVQFRMPLVPGINDDATNLQAVAAFLLARGQRELRLVPYQRHYLGKYRALGRVAPLAALPEASAEHLRQAASRLAALGIGTEVDG